MSVTISSFHSHSTALDRVDLFGKWSTGQPAVVRVCGIDRCTFRLLLRGPDGGFDSHGAAQELAREFDGAPLSRSCPMSAEALGQTLRLSLGGDEASPAIEIDLDKGTFSLVGQDGSVTSVLRIVGESDDTRLGATSIIGTLSEGESVYGTGERFDSIDRRAKAVQIWAVDRWCETEGNSYVPVPFFFTTEGYGVYLNRFEPSSIDLGSNDESSWRMDTEGAPLDCYVFIHDSPKEILNAYASLTGFAPVPPEWSFGIHVCRHLRLGEFATPDGIKAMTSSMAEHDLPFSSVIIEGWDTYDRETYPALKAITAELHEHGKKVLVYEPCGRFPNFWIDDRREPNEAQWQQASANEVHMIHDEAGSATIEEAMAYNPEDAPRHRESRFLDLTNPEAIRWWKDEVWGRLVKEIGIDGAKIDFCEQVPEGSGVYHDGSSPQGMHHRYPVLYNTMMYRYYQEHRRDGGVCFSRGGGIGAQRYPFMWCGDQLREWRFLQAILNAMVSSGLSGIPFMSHDLAGYMPTRDPDHNDEARVFVRGTELGCFSGNMQTHGIVTRPYDFEPDIVAIYRLYSKIHYLLVPYLVEQAEVSSREGVPLLRHLYLEFPGNNTVRSIEDEYLLGDGLLVAPILTDTDTRRIYFPEGNWTGLFDDRRIEGPRTETAWRADLADTPVFLREPCESDALNTAVAQIRTLYNEFVTG